jgi:GTP-binding protein
MYELGLGDVFPISAAHGRGTAELCDALVAGIVAHEDAEDVAPAGTRIAFVGRPNAGKSSLVNALLGQPRVIVDANPGTTRDPIHLPFRRGDDELVLVDTAGMRRRRQAARAQEKLAVIKAIRSIERTEVVVLVIDASEGVADQDQRIARLAFRRGKGVVVALHKWDLVVGDARTVHERSRRASEALAFLERPHIIKSSVVGPGRDTGTGKAFGLDALVDACLATQGALSRRIPTADLNDELARAVAEHSPPTFRGRRVRLYYATQAETDPPLVVISANHGRCLDVAYERYLLRRIRTRWHLRGIPVRLVVRGRGRGNPERARGRHQG